MKPGAIRLEPIGLDESSKKRILSANPECRDMLEMSVDFYMRVGFEAPWIGYFVFLADKMVGSCGFKGAPKNNTVEIAYFTFPEFEKRGIGTEMCRQLTGIARKKSASVRITARTLPEENASARILRNNQYEFAGKVLDEDDGEVWEFVYAR